MFKNWSNTNKTIAAVVVLALIAFVLYELKVFGNTTSLLNLRGIRKYCGGGLIQTNQYVAPIPAFNQGGLVNTGCGVAPTLTPSGIPIEVVPARY